MSLVVKSSGVTTWKRRRYRSASKTTFTRSVSSPRLTLTLMRCPSSSSRSRRAMSSAASGSYFFPTSFCMSSRSAWLRTVSEAPLIATLSTS